MTAPLTGIVSSGHSSANRGSRRPQDGDLTPTDFGSGLGDLISGC
jgi:hypothetical protein